MHRLDRETSGALAVARTPDAAAWLSACFREHAESAEALALTARSPRGSAPANRPVMHPRARVEDRHVGRERHGKRLQRAGRSPIRDGRSATALQSPAGATGGAAVQRTYWAIVEVGDVAGGELPASGRIDAAIWGGGGGGALGDDPSSPGGAWRPAATVFEVVQQGGGYAWLELRPETGEYRLLTCHDAQMDWLLTNAVTPDEPVARRPRAGSSYANGCK